MVAKSDKEKVKTLLSETIRLLCKNGLHFKSEFCVEALVGITLDRDEEFFLSIKETVKSELVSSTKESVPHRKSKSERRSREYVVKGEPSLSSCQRKRPAEVNTSDNEDLGELALGEIQEGEQQFWSSVTEEGDGDEGGGVPVKKRHIQIPDDSSSSNQQIVVKGEPDSDSDCEEVASTCQDDPQPMSMLPGSFSFPAPSTSGQSFLGNIPHSAIPQQVWDQLPPFSTLPGTSGIPSAPNTVTSQDGHQQVLPFVPFNFGTGHASPLFASSKQLAKENSCNDTPTESTNSPKKSSRRQLSEYDVAQRILLAKGSSITPRQVTMTVNGRWKADEIVRLMFALEAEGAGHTSIKRNKVLFIKKPADQISDILMTYNIPEEKYIDRFLCG